MQISTTFLLSSSDAVCLVEVEIFLDEHDRAIRAGDDGLRARAGEPVNHRAAHEQAEDDLRLHEAQMCDGVAKNIFEQHDDAENHRGRADDGGADQHGFGGRLEGVARAVAFFEFELGVGEIGFEAEISFDFRADVRLRFDAAQFINGLRVVGDGAEAVHGNRHRSHREKTERDEAEGKNRRGEVELRRHEREQRGVLREQIRDEHERQNHEAHPERGEISGDEAGQNVQRRAAVVGGVGDFADVARAGADENFREFHDERARERAARDDGGQHPPEIRLRRSPVASVKSPSSSLLAMKQTMMETMDVIQTRSVSGASQLKFFLPP